MKSRLRTALLLGTALILLVGLGCAVEKRTTVELHESKADCAPAKACLHITILDGSNQRFFGAAMSLTCEGSSVPQRPVPLPNDGFIHPIISEADFVLNGTCRNYVLHLAVSATMSPGPAGGRAQERKYEIPITLLPSKATNATIRLGCYRYDAVYD